MEGTLFSIPVKSFELIGFHRIEKLKRPKLFKVIQLFGISSIIYNFLAEIYFIKLNHHDVLALAEAFAPLSTEFIALSKMITFFFWKEKFYKLMDQIKDLATDSSSSDVLILKRINKFTRNVGIAYILFGTFACVGYCAIPLAFNAVNVLIYGAEYDYKMPYKSAYPYDTSSFPAYEFSYALFCWGTLAVFFICVGVDTFFLGSCLNICAQLDILRESFDGDKRKFVKRHIKILSLAESLNDMIKPVVFIQFLVTSILLCVIGFQIVVHTSFMKKGVAGVLGITIMIQLFSYSYGGQLITDRSSAVADHFYQTDKDLLIVIRRAQKAVQIRAGFYQATLPAFSSILSSAASLITLLQSFLE